MLAFALLIAFVFIQVWKPEQATLPPRIFLQRSIASGFWASCCLGAHTILFGKSSGISKFTCDRLPTDDSVLSSQGQCIGFQVLYGFGLGTCNQIPNMAAQTVLPREQVAIGASFMFFGQQLFGAVFTSVGQNVLSNQLAKRLVISPQMVQNSGATQLLDHVPVEDRAAAVVSYNDSLRTCFQVGLVMACLAIVGGVAMDWRSDKKKQLPLKPETDNGQADEGKEQGGLKEKKPLGDAQNDQSTAADGAMRMSLQSETETQAESE